LARLGEMLVRIGAEGDTPLFFGCVAGKGLRELRRFFVRRGLIRENVAENIIPRNG
jgi:hypothetical protein